MACSLALSLSPVLSSFSWSSVHECQQCAGKNSRQADRQCWLTFSSFSHSHYHTAIDSLFLSFSLSHRHRIGRNVRALALKRIQTPTFFLSFSLSLAERAQDFKVPVSPQSNFVYVWIKAVDPLDRVSVLFQPLPPPPMKMRNENALAIYLPRQW